MSDTKRTVAKNASVLMVAQVITWSLSLLMAIYLPRYLGPAGIGHMALAGSLWAIAGVFIGFGMGGLIVKEIARDHSKTSALLNTTLIIRMLFYIIGFIAIVLFAKVANYPAETVIIIFIFAIPNFLGLFGDSTRSGLEGLERMEFIAVADVVSKAVSVGITLALILLDYGIYIIAAVGIITALVSFGIQYYSLNRLQKLHINIDFSQVKWMLKESSPFFLTGISIVLYHQIDTVILSLLVGAASVGWYSVVDTLFGTLLFVPTVFFTAVYPALSRMYAQDPTAMPKVMNRSFNLLLIIAVPMGLGLVVVSNALVVLLYGAEFAKSGPILAIKGIVMIFTYQTILLGTFLISIDRQKAWALIMATAAIATIPLDLFFIPIFETLFHNGAMGGAWAYLITEIFMMIAGLRLLPKGTLGRTNAWLAVKVVLAGLIMFVFSWLVRDYFIAIPIIVGVVAYGISILVLRVVPEEDWLLLKQVGQAMIARLPWRRQLRTDD